MSVIKKMRKQMATLWVRTTPDAFGKFAFAPPVGIKCRWDDKLGEFKDKTGQSFGSKATVYTDRVVHVGDKLKKGGLDSTTLDSPLKDKEAFEVIATEDIPNFKAKEFLHVAYL